MTSMGWLMRVCGWARRIGPLSASSLRMARDERLWMWLHLSSTLEAPAVISSCWRTEFCEKMRLRRNWLQGRCVVSRLQGHKEAVNCFAACGDVIVSGADDTDLRVWDVKRTAQKACVHVLSGHSGKVLCCCIVKGLVVSGSEDKTVMAWDLTTGKVKGQLRQHTQAVLCMCTDGSKYVYTGGGDYELCKWNINTLKCEGVMRNHRAPILCICLGCDPGIVITGSRDRDARMWNTNNAPSSACTLTMSGHDEAVTCVHAARCGTGAGSGLGGADAFKIATGSDDKSIRIWGGVTGVCLSVISEHYGPLSGVLLHGPLLMSSSFDGKVRVIDVITGRIIRTMSGHRNAVLTLDAKGTVLVTGGNDRDVRVWNLEETKDDHACPMHTSQHRVSIPVSVCSHHDGPQSKNAHGYALCGHNSGIQRLSIVGERIVTASDDYELRIWDFGAAR